MNEREHEARRDEIAAYLLGALDPGEAAALEQHLAGCEECRTELDWLRPAAHVLPEGVERVEPPSGLRARIMDEVQVDAVQRPERVRRRLRGRRDSAVAPGPTAAARRRSLLRPAIGLAAVVAVLAGLAGYAIRDGGSGDGSSTVIAGKAPGVTVEVVRTAGSGTLRLAHLHQLPADEVLQAWVRRGERIESAKTLFVPNRDGTATAVIDDMEGVNAVMVTAEPRGGSAHPTSAPIVTVAMPQ